MFELRKLDLHLAFVAARALREDVEYQARTVDDTALQTLFEVALLHGRKLVVEDREWRMRRGNDIGDLLHLAFACEERRVGTITTTFDYSERVDARAFCKLPRFRQALRIIGLTEIEADEHRLRPAALPFDHQVRREADIRRLSSGLPGS